MSRLEICVSSLLRLIIEDTYIDRQRLHVSWLVQSFPILILDVDEKSIWHYTEAYILQHIFFIFFSGKSGDKVHLMFLRLPKEFEVADSYS